MAGMRAAFTFVFLNFVQQRVKRTKRLTPATSYALNVAGNFHWTNLPSTIMHEPYDKRLGRQFDFKVKYRLYKPEEGGRKTVLYQGIRYDFAYSDFGTNDFNVYMIWPEFENENGQVIIEDFEIIKETGTARMWIINDDIRNFHKDKIAIGTKGFMMEGNRKMGECEVTDIVGLQISNVEK